MQAKISECFDPLQALAFRLYHCSTSAAEVTATDWLCQNFKDIPALLPDLMIGLAPGQ